MVSDDAVALADEVALLVDWLRYDILTVAGPCHADRCVLYDFVVAELQAPRRSASIGWGRFAAPCRINGTISSPSPVGSMRIWSNWARLPDPH